MLSRSHKQTNDEDDDDEEDEGDVDDDDADDDDDDGYDYSYEYSYNNKYLLLTTSAITFTTRYGKRHRGAPSNTRGRTASVVGICIR